MNNSNISFHLRSFLANTSSLNYNGSSDCSDLFDEYGVDNLVAFDVSNPDSSWYRLTRTSNTFILTIPGQDMKIIKIGVPVEAIGLPQEEDGYSSDIVDLAIITMSPTALTS